MASMHPDRRRPGRCVFWSLLLLTTLALASWTPVIQAQSPDFGVEIYSRTNAIRAERGLYAFVWNDQLAAAARRHANDMAAMGWISHTGSDGSRVRDRARDAGYPGYSWGLMVGENIYGGYTLGRPQDAMTWWMNSTVHRNQILSTRFRELGAASAGSGGYTYYVMVFGDRPDVPAVPPAPPAPPAEPPAANAQPTAEPVAANALPDGSIVYTVQRGDTLYAISRRFGVPVNDLLALNHLSESSVLRIGQNIVISLGPGAAAATPETPPAALDKPIAQPADLDNLPPGAVVYTVRAGDTVLDIALRYGVNPDDIAALNGLPDVNALSVGQKLVVSMTPLAARPSTAPSLDELAEPPPGPPSNPQAQANGSTNEPRGLPVHIVREGDTLLDIAAQYDVSLDNLIKLNRLADQDTLALGQVLILSAIPQSVYNDANTDRPPRPVPLVWLIHTPPEDEFTYFIHLPQGG
jgi:uncharacterized protein YkwD/nucleoid-associated protein YgaU